MAFDPYTSCPCGSGQKFKWCCQPIHESIMKAFELDSKGQHEAAMRTMEEVVAAHAANPEAWGRKAQLLFQQERAEDAETALQKAFELNPRYAYGYYLRGKFRQFEGEIVGALSLFRKAVECYDPAAREILADLYADIADCENRLNHPIAVRAALLFVQRFQPTNADVRQAIVKMFGDNSALPLAARREYQLMPQSAGAAAEQRQGWQTALEGAATGKLSDAIAAFEELTRRHEQEPAAWYNLALCRAWAGSNAAAVEALARYVETENDERRAADAWTLGEVLRLGQGMEDQADYVRYMVTVQVHDRTPLLEFLRDLANNHRLANAQTDQENDVFSAMILQKTQTLSLQGPVRMAPRMAANIIIIGNILRAWSISRADLDEFAGEMMRALASAVGQPISNRGPAGFAEVFAEALAFPIGYDADEAKRRMEEEFERFFEETWLRRPLKSLNQIPPVDAAQNGQLRKKLQGVIQFLEQCGAVVQAPYDFGRLRHKLGLLEGAAAPAAAAPDINAMNAADLGGLNAEALSEADAELAYQAALKLDARELAANFARTLVSRPPGARRDRLPWYNHLVQMAMAEDDVTAALDFLDEGEKYDCEHNEGKRRNDFELRRGQLHARSGQIDQARDVFDRLIAREPRDLRLRGSAAEAMLSARQGQDALRIAESGLAEARQQKNRDSEAYFSELAEAARKLG